MARKKLIRTTNFPYHVTARCNNRENYPLDLLTMWEIYIYHAHKIFELYRAEIHAFTLMSNHYHMIISTQREDLGIVMNFFQRETAQTTNFLAEKINHLYGNKYHWSLIKTQEDFYNVLRYVYQNPMRTQFPHDILTYPYSTFNQWINNHDTPFPLSDRYIDRCNEKNLSTLSPLISWIKSPTTEYANDCLKRGLKRYEFKVRANKNTKKLPEDLFIRENRFAV